MSAADLLGLKAASADELMGRFRDIVLTSATQDGLVFDPQSLRAIIRRNCYRRASVTMLRLHCGRPRHPTSVSPRSQFP